MIIQAKVINVSKTFTGKSATTGKDWANKGILLGWEDEDGEQFIRAQVAENIWHEYALQVGDVGCIALRFRTIQSCKSNYVYNDIRIVPLPNRQ
jgi:hypothetical protein